MSSAKIFWLYAQAGVHVGVGQGAGFIDLPIMREKITNWPVIPGSTVKGVLRDYYQQMNRTGINTVFGQSGDDTAGALVLTDARIVILPVRSLYGTYAYITSPLALQRLVRDAEFAGEAVGCEIPNIEPDKIHIESNGSQLVNAQKVYLEDLDFNVVNCDCTKKWAEYLGGKIFGNDGVWKEIFKQRFAIVSDETFNFLCEVGTEVNARIRIAEETKTVERGALWYEEMLPAESILAGIAWCDKVFDSSGYTPDKILDDFCTGSYELQIGGKATVGKGRMRCIFAEKEG